MGEHPTVQRLRGLWRRATFRLRASPDPRDPVAKKWIDTAFGEYDRAAEAVLIHRFPELTEKPDEVK